ncbi:uncharacterized protein LOC121972924 [Zingiber officinale]|uniref:uncharacterized protein LOC121972924 n=1 Tax=Zingiber officinale TaxID=94328 RepID=UPI001C4C204B|nr:uncharacterized protein LOC121972924 [Zingiber officinale]
MVEVEPLARITEQMVMKLIWQHIIYRFSIPRWLVLDNGRQFVGQGLREWCGGYDIQQAFTSVAYPQSNGQVEVANHEILIILHARLDHTGGSWVDELPSVLWALRMTPKKGIGATTSHLVYGGEAVVPVEVGVESDRMQHYSEDNAERRLLELDLVGKCGEGVADTSSARDPCGRRWLARSGSRQEMALQERKEIAAGDGEEREREVWESAIATGDGEERERESSRIAISARARVELAGALLLGLTV